MTNQLLDLLDMWGYNHTALRALQKWPNTRIEIDLPNTIFLNSNVLACTERRNKNEAPDPGEGSCER